MRRWVKRIVWTVAVLIGVPLIAALLLYLLSDTGPGRRSIEELAALFSGGQVRITGLDGEFPDAIRAAHVEVADDHGVWLTLDDAQIAWSPWGFLDNHVTIASVRAAHAQLLRFPISTSTDNTPATTRYDIGALTIDRADFDKALTGRPISIALNARGHYTNENDAQWVLSADEIGGTGTYRSEGAIDGTRIEAHMTAREAVHGLLASLADLPDIGALTIDAHLWGPRTAENVDARIQAGPAKIRAEGGLDLVQSTLNLDIAAQGPAMAPRPDLSWTAFVFEGHARGSFKRPQASGHLSVSGLHAAGGMAQSIAGDLSGTGGALRFTGQADGVRLPVREPDLLASSPFTFAVNAQLGGAAPQIDFEAAHPLVSLKGHVSLADHTVVTANLRLARIAPFAQLAGVDLDGSAALTAHIDSAKDGDSYAASGTIDAAGPQLLSRVLGRGTHIDVAIRTSATGFSIDKAHVASSGVTLDASGSQQGETLALSYSAALSDLSRVSSALVGHLTSQGRVAGDAKNFVVTASATGSTASKGYEQGPVTLSLDAQGLPGQARGALTGQGRFDAAPLRLAAAFEPRGNAHAVTLKSFDWRSLHATGAFVVPADTRGTTGHVAFDIGQLADAGALIGQALKGALHGAVDVSAQGGRTLATVHGTANGLVVAGVAAQSVALDGRIADPLGAADSALTLKAGGLAVGGVTGGATAHLAGPLAALHVALNGDLKNGGDAVPLVADATLDIPAKTATLAKLETTYRGEPFRLSAPAHVDFSNGLSVDRLQILSDHAEIRVAGRIAPTLAVEASLQNASPDLIRIFVPALDADGTISGTAKLAGSLDAPTGTVAVQATGIHIRGAGGGLPPASITANGTLHGKTMALTAHIEAGASAHLALDGSVPLEAGGAFNLKADGTIDLAVLNPVLTATGRRVRGLVTLDGRFTGNPSAPRASGTAVLVNGQYADFQQGLRVTKIAAHIDAKGDTVTVTSLSGKAGPGTISGSGTIALWADGIPLNLSVKLVNARPLATDLFSGVLDADLKVTGNLRDRMVLGGTARIDKGHINIAESYPPEVAVLDIRRSRDAPAPVRPPARAAIGLDLTITAANRITVRGRGLDAEVGGSLSIKGDSNAPLVNGGFVMRRGEVNLGGSNVQFSSGKITFDGQSVNGSFDPALDFTAQSTSGSVTAKLAITGHASAPRIALSSTPTLPQDEVLAHLLFGQSVAQLNALQLAQIAQAFAEIGGVGGGFNPLGAVRRTLGLDKFAVSSAASGNGATIEVGKNIGSNIYVGAKQDTAGGTQAVAQIDLSEHLKLQATVTAVASATPTTPTATPQENGTSVGLSYQFEY